MLGVLMVGAEQREPRSVSRAIFPLVLAGVASAGWAQKGSVCRNFSSELLFLDESYLLREGRSKSAVRLHPLGPSRQG